MKLRGTVLTLIASSMLLLGATAAKHRFMERWVAPDLDRTKFQKILVIGITDDARARGVFEDRFVSLLRGRYVEGVTSRSLVPDLQKIENPQSILDQIKELGIDGAISVRLVSLKTRTEEEWDQEWRSAIEGGQTLRQLIDESLPIDDTKVKEFGLEAGLWVTADGKPLWAARTDTYRRKELKKEASNFVQMVMNALAQEDLLTGPP